MFLEGVLICSFVECIVATYKENNSLFKKCLGTHNATLLRWLKINLCLVQLVLKIFRLQLAIEFSRHCPIASAKEPVVH